MWSFIVLAGFIQTVVGGASNFINFGGFICPREEKALGRCLRDALNTYIPQLSAGLPEYNIPPCEPLIIPSLTVKQNAGPIHITSTYHDVTVKGPSNMEVTDVKVISKKHQVIAKLKIPELRMRGDYTLKGQLLMLPIEGDGKFAAKYGDIDAMVNIILGRRHEEGQPDTLKCEELDVKFNVGTATMQMDNLFGGDGELGNAMNNFLNENWQTLAAELQPPMEEALKDFFRPLADHAFATLKADDILS